jgi:hypothetical protein
MDKKFVCKYCKRKLTPDFSYDGIHKECQSCHEEIYWLRKDFENEIQNNYIWKEMK